MLSARTVLLSWSGRPGSVYTLRYRARTLRHSRYRYVNVTTTTAKIDQLRPNTEYEISVKVSRGSRHSTWSMSVHVRTSEAGKLRRTPVRALFNDRTPSVADYFVCQSSRRLWIPHDTADHYRARDNSTFDARGFIFASKMFNFQPDDVRQATADYLVVSQGNRCRHGQYSCSSRAPVMKAWHRCAGWDSLMHQKALRYNRVI